MGQLWSQPRDGHPKENVFSQQYVEQFRAQWFASLDPNWTLLLDAKASGKDNVVREDYFLKADILYQGWDKPFYPYGGMRFPESGNWVVYGGVETMSYRPGDVHGKARTNVPLAARGWLELRYQDGQNSPTLRVQGLIHTLPDLFASLPGPLDGLVLSAGIDSHFNDDRKAEWLAVGHIDWTLKRGFARPMIVSGYAVDMSTGEQRASLGLGVELF